jgi:hypothetical protein
MNARHVFKLLLLLTLVFTSACRSKMPVEEAYTTMQGAVGFDFELEKGPADLGQTTVWLGSSRSEGHVATFRMELDTGQKLKGSFPSSVGTGKFLPVAGSDATVFLAQLKTALEAKAIPQGVKRASSVPFTYAVLAQNSRRGKNGSFGIEKTGNWLALKLFFRDGEPEVYLNVNPVLRKGEFTIKDPDYGDAVLTELAKVL